MEKKSTRYDIPAVVEGRKKRAFLSKNAGMIIKIMRVAMIQITVALAFAGLAIAHPNHAQEVLNREVSLKLNEVTLEKALTELETKAKVKFGYSRNKLNLDVKVSMDADRKKLGEVLDVLLGPNDIT